MISSPVIVTSEVLSLLGRSFALLCRTLGVNLPSATEIGPRMMVEIASGSHNKTLGLFSREMDDRLDMILDEVENLTDFQLENFSKRLEIYNSDLANSDRQTADEIIDFVLALPYNLHADLVNYSIELEQHVKRRSESEPVALVKVADHATFFYL